MISPLKSFQMLFIFQITQIILQQNSCYLWINILIWNKLLGETLQGNKMDSSNLATLFAPNILHTVKPGTETMSTSDMATHAEERIDVINVIRSMIDHNKELFQVYT